jgi:hypothetical protein
MLIIPTGFMSLTSMRLFLVPLAWPGAGIKFPLRSNVDVGGRKDARAASHLPQPLSCHRSLLTRLVPGRLLVKSGKEQFSRGWRANGTIDYDVLRRGSLSVKPLVAIVVGAES